MARRQTSTLATRADIRTEAVAFIGARLRFGRLLVLKAKRRAKTIERRLTRIFVIDLLFRTVKEMSDDDATHMAAGVAYYALFSLFPLLLGLIAVFSYFIDSSPGEGNDLATEGVTRFVSEYLPGSETFVSENLEILLNLRGAATVVAVLGMFWSASAVFGALSRAVNRAWDVHQDRPFYLNKTRQLAMALGVACLFLLSFGAATLVRAAGLLGDLDAPQVSFMVNHVGTVVLQTTSFVLVLSAFLLIYKFTPNTTTYWRYIWPGAIAAALLFEVTKNLFIIYLNSFASFDDIYGPLAPVIVLLLWTYVSSLIIISGAELSSEYGRLKLGISRGMPFHPPSESPDVPTTPGD